ncbi:ATP binding microtubule motor family protein, putative isoform 1 [Hibiscus syriacus]|uniref:ATP binding microtubule motor family protein, putative isoform 1 n=1 Tax=Hibiscus syriacus TaxID=106335 RepID=A0A6A2YMA6_HIBSY|nr:ATP binding microtubule motor family protein, putative isoform 1 [Hibiscus syriacus]
MATRGSRSEKVKRIFQQFDNNRDGGLSRDEMAALVVAVNPRVKFSDEQINAILDEVFRTYGEFIDGEKGLTYDGLLRTYDDGAGDVDRDFDALGLELNPDEAKGGSIVSEASSSIADEGVAESHRKQRTAAWAVSPHHDIVFDDTWKLIDELEILLKRLKSKQAKEGKLKIDNFDAYSDAGWSRELGPSAELSEKRVYWEESGPDYAIFVKELGALRSRADGARSREEAFDGQMAIGRVLYEHQLFKEALVSFKRSCELQPTDVRPHFRAGNCLYVLGKCNEAKDEFLLALESAEAGGNQWGYLLPQIYVNLGIALEGEGMVLSACEAAAKALEEAIFIKPDYADAHCDLASALHAVGEDERAIEVFQKAIDLKPGHVDALYNLAHKAVSLLGAGETEEAKKALKEALKRRIGSKPSKFKTVGEKTTLRQDLGNAIQIRAFQRITRLSRCDVDLLKKEMNETDVPVSYSGGGAPLKSIRKPNLEEVLRRLLRSLKPETFQGSVKAINERILSVLDETGSGRVDLGMFMLFLPPFFMEKRIPRWCRTVNFLPCLMIQMGFGIMSTLLKLETGDRNRHGRQVCSVCRYPVIGSRFKEVKSHFSLCNQCYSEGKVPPSFKQDEYKFKEYGSEAEAMKDKCMCFTLQSHKAP